MANVENTYKFDVKMTCGGCSGAVTRALKKAQDTVSESGNIASYDVNLEKQEVIVKGTRPYDEVLGVIQKTGKEVRSGQILPREGIN